MSGRGIAGSLGDSLPAACKANADQVSAGIATVDNDPGKETPVSIAAHRNDPCGALREQRSQCIPRADAKRPIAPRRIAATRETTPRSRTATFGTSQFRSIDVDDPNPFHAAPDRIAIMNDGMRAGGEGCSGGEGKEAGHVSRLPQDHAHHQHR